MVKENASWSVIKPCCQRVPRGGQRRIQHSTWDLSLTFCGPHALFAYYDVQIGPKLSETAHKKTTQN